MTHSVLSSHQHFQIESGAPYSSLPGQSAYAASDYLGEEPGKRQSAELSHAYSNRMDATSNLDESDSSMISQKQASQHVGIYEFTHEQQQRVLEILSRNVSAISVNFTELASRVSNFASGR